MKKKQSEMNIINEIKNILDGINRLGEAEKLISDLEDIVMESNQAEERREKKIGKMRIDLGKSVTPSSIITFIL